MPDHRDSCVTSAQRESLKDHFLEQILDTEKFKAFYLREKPDSRMMSTLIIFSPEAIILCGDLTPARNGNVSVLGYGLHWFAGFLSEGYLAEKFLQKGWHQNLAERELTDLVAQIKAGKMDDFDPSLGLFHDDRIGMLEELKISRKEPEIKAKLKSELVRCRAESLKLRSKIVGELDDLLGSLVDMGQDSFCDAYRQIDPHCEDFPGWGYNPTELGWLCAIQQKFSELYHKKAGTVPD